MPFITPITSLIVPGAYCEMAIVGSRIFLGTGIATGQSTLSELAFDGEKLSLVRQQSYGTNTHGRPCPLEPLRWCYWEMRDGGWWRRWEIDLSRADWPAAAHGDDIGGNMATCNGRVLTTLPGSVYLDGAKVSVDRVLSTGHALISSAATAVQVDDNIRIALQRASETSWTIYAAAGGGILSLALSSSGSVYYGSIDGKTYAVPATPVGVAPWAVEGPVAAFNRGSEPWLVTVTSLHGENALHLRPEGSATALSLARGATAGWVRVGMLDANLALVAAYDDWTYRPGAVITLDVIDLSAERSVPVAPPPPPPPPKPEPHQPTIAVSAPKPAKRFVGSYYGGPNDGRWLDAEGKPYPPAPGNVDIITHPWDGDDGKAFGVPFGYAWNQANGGLRRHVLSDRYLARTIPVDLLAGIMVHFEGGLSFNQEKYEADFMAARALARELKVPCYVYPDAPLHDWIVQETIMQRVLPEAPDEELIILIPCYTLTGDLAEDEKLFRAGRDWVAERFRRWAFIRKMYVRIDDDIRWVEGSQLIVNRLLDESGERCVADLAFSQDRPSGIMSPVDGYPSNYEVLRPWQMAVANATATPVVRLLKNEKPKASPGSPSPKPKRKANIGKALKDFFRMLGGLFK